LEPMLKSKTKDHIFENIFDFCSIGLGIQETIYDPEIW